MKLNKILSYLSKKGVLLFGIVVGLLIAVFSSIIVNAEELDGIDDDTSSGSVIISTCLYAKSSTNTYEYEYNIYVDKDSDYLSRMCCMETSGSTVNGNSCVTVTLLANYTMTGTIVRDGVTSDFSGTSISTDTSVQSYSCMVYRFATLSECQQYLAGELDASVALNYDEINEAQKQKIYDSGIPYYDNTTLSLMGNESCVLDANMSSTQKELFDSYCDLYGSTPFYVEIYSHAIYAENKQLGMYNQFVIDYGSSNKLGNILPNADKVDELIRFDSSGRLYVSGEQGISGGGGRHGASFVISETSPLIAYSYETITFRDGVIGTSHFTKDIIFDGPAIEGYTLMGYMTEVNLVFDDGENYIYGKKAYSYTWMTAALRDRFGSKTVFYDGDGNQISGEEVNFDKYGNIISDSDDVDVNSLWDYIENGFILLGEDGFLGLLQQTFLGVPIWIWTLVGTALTIQLAVMVFKVLG